MLTWNTVDSIMCSGGKIQSDPMITTGENQKKMRKHIRATMIMLRWGACGTGFSSNFKFFSNMVILFLAKEKQSKKNKYK
jgi:hypothetical protein